MLRPSVRLFFLYTDVTIWHSPQFNSPSEFFFFFKSFCFSSWSCCRPAGGAAESRRVHLLWDFFGKPPPLCVFTAASRVCECESCAGESGMWVMEAPADADADTGGRDGDRPCRFGFARRSSVESSLRKSSRCSLTFLCWSFLLWRHSLWCIHETDPRSRTFETFESWSLEGLYLWPGSESKLLESTLKSCVSVFPSPEWYFFFVQPKSFITVGTTVQSVL